MHCSRVLKGTVVCLCALLWVGGAQAQETLSVFVSIPPQKYFVERIGGPHVDVSIMVPQTANPHTYEPKPQQMVALSRARIYYAVGVSFERVWLHRIASANPEMLVVHTEKGIEKRPMKAHAHHGESPGAAKQEHGGIRDPHIWLSPPLVMLQARNILEALLAVDPARREIYETNYKRFIMDLVDLDAEISGVFAGKGRDIEFMVFHPAWGYFAEAYGLEQVPIEIEGKEPKPAELQGIIRHAREKGIKVVFVQPQFSTRSAETIAKAIGGQVAFADPLAPEWADNLREVAAKFRAALR
jgi:zinc transport system substrate-binding protein